MNNWHTLSTGDVLDEMALSLERGLSEAAARRRMTEYGPNQLREHARKSLGRMLWEQLCGVLIVILIAAAAVSALLGEWADALVILLIIILNAVLGLFQEQRAEKALLALKKMAQPHARVRRDGTISELPAPELVPGDLIYLEAGNVVPADCRLLETAALKVEEAVLTGESVPVEKRAEISCAADTALADRQNMVYMGTIVAHGRATAVVVATGMRTQLGGIADLLQSVRPDPTPLQKKLDHFGRILAVAVAGLVTIIFVQGLMRDGIGWENIRLIFLTAISMAVAAVPEGLPAVVTIALALGAQRMLRRNALIRKLPAVETLGSVTVICSDKTGTLTENRMTLTTLALDEQLVDLTAKQPKTDGSVPMEQADALSLQPRETLLLLAIGALCNDAVFQQGTAKPDPARTIGDPTEKALIRAAAEWGLWKPALEHAWPRVGEMPFDTERKRMTTVHKVKEPLAPLLNAILSGLGINSPESVAFCKGAPEGVLDVCDRIWTQAGILPLTMEQRQKVLAFNDKLAAEGLRVLGMALRESSSVMPEEEKMVFVGQVGLMDPPREGVRQAVETCRFAGIRPMMITGDHPLVARVIARQTGMAANSATLTGPEMDKLTAEELRLRVNETVICARVTPEHKLRIVEALQANGETVAMTGDGVNDAPALRKADIGVAMGISGADVSKETADMVLQDDCFATIVAAVREGRVIYDNIRKFIKYLLSTNLGELLVMLVAPFLGLPLPLLPIQILWVNLVTDGLPALALSLEPAEPNIMRRPPARATEQLFGDGIARHIIWVGIFMTIVALGVGWWDITRSGLNFDDSARLFHFRTMMFTVITFLQLAHVLAIRSHYRSLFSMGIFTNKALLGAVVLTFFLQLALIYVPFLQTRFHTAALSGAELLLCCLAAASLFGAVELEKWLRRRQKD